MVVILKKIQFLITIILSVILFTFCTNDTTSNQNIEIEAPTNLTATLLQDSISNDFIKLCWLDNSSNEEVFKIQRKTGPYRFYQDIGTVGENNTTFSDYNFEINTQYFYRVYAYRQGIQSNYSNETEIMIFVDVTPPLRPELIQHLGDTGDIENDSLGVVIDTLNYYTTDGLENNGIDAIPTPPGSERIKIQWKHLLDTDIDYVEFYRFTLEDYYSGNESTKIDSVSIPNIDEYTDDFENIASPVYKHWFYFMKAADTSGNWTISDTVCYQIIDSPYLISPDYSEIFSCIYDVTFNWQHDPTVTSYRLLLFDENYNLLWSYDLVSNQEMPIDYPANAPNLESQVIYWRVDTFGQTIIEEINGKYYTIYAGSESEWRILYIQ